VVRTVVPRRPFVLLQLRVTRMPPKSSSATTAQSWSAKATASASSEPGSTSKELLAADPVGEVEGAHLRL